MPFWAQTVLSLPSICGNPRPGSCENQVQGDHISGSQAWGLTIQATAVVEPIQRGWNKKGAPRAVGEPDGPSHQCKEHRSGLVMGEELTRESPLLLCHDDVRSETGQRLRDRQEHGQVLLILNMELLYYNRSMVRVGF